MELEIRLRALLQEFRLDHHGVSTEIANDLGVHRQTVGKLYHGTAQTVSVPILAKICRWLSDRGVPRDRLPGALFTWRPAGLWRAMAAPGAVRIYIGEYQQMENDWLVMRWISRRDSEVASEIIRALSARDNVSGAHPQVSTQYVPFRFSRSASNGAPRKFRQVAARVQSIYERIRSNRTPSASVLVGSQRVCHLTECLVADLFGCTPFEPTEGESRPPFYFLFRGDHRQVDSCFGGPDAPPGWQGEARPGTYFLNEEGQWNCYPWKKDQADAGVVITDYDPGNGAIIIATFGFSGRGTEAIGREVVRDSPQFWKDGVQYRSRRVAVYVCHFDIAPATPDSDAPGRARRFETYPIDSEVLKACLA